MDRVKFYCNNNVEIGRDIGVIPNKVIMTGLLKLFEKKEYPLDNNFWQVNYLWQSVKCG